MRTITIILTALTFIISCHGKTGALTSEQSAGVKDSVQAMMEVVSNKVSHEGPVAWLQYFEKNPGFFMAVNGQIALANNDSATHFIKTTLVKMMSEIKLQWSNIRIDPLTTEFASVAANFHEDISYTSGIKKPSDGYFTAIVHKTSNGWQLRNVHWSIIATN